MYKYCILIVFYVVNINDIYNPIWPDEKYFVQLKSDLEKYFGDKILVTHETTKVARTRVFEVILINPHKVHAPY